MNIAPIGPGWPITKAQKDSLIRSFTSEGGSIVFIGSERTAQLFAEMHTPGGVDYSDFGPSVVKKVIFLYIEKRSSRLTLVDLIGRRLISNSNLISHITLKKTLNFVIIDNINTPWETYINEITAKPIEEELQLIQNQKCVIL